MRAKKLHHKPKITHNMDMNEIAKQNKEILKLAGSVKLSKKEADTLVNEVYKERKIAPMRL